MGFCLTLEYDSTTEPSYPVRKIKGLTGTGYADLNSWPTLDEGALEEKKRNIFLKRKNGVIMYLSGYPESEIHNACEIGLKHIHRLIKERCLLTHPDGLIYGWRGLVPGQHINPYTRTKAIKVDDYGFGAVGAMQTILALHYDLREKLNKKILEVPKSSQLGQIKKPKISIWSWFIDELRKLGYEQRGDWPFGTKSRGYYSICRYIDQVLNDNPKKATLVLGGPDAAKKFIAGDGVDRPVFKVYQRVEMDAHKLDGKFCVMMPTLDGDYHPKIIYHIWVIVIIEIVSRAVLGYYLSMAKEVSKDDVLRTIKHALTT